MIRPGIAFLASGRSSVGSHDPFFSNVVLLLHCDGPNASTTFTDSSSKNHVVTPTASQIASSPSKFGTGSASVTSGNASLDVASSSDFAFGTSDFTIEFWFITATAWGSSNLPAFIETRDSSGSGNGPVLYVDSTPQLIYYNGSNRILGGSPSVPTLSAWTHIAICRSSGVTRLFVGGSQVGTNYADTSNYPASRLRISSSYLGANSANGYIDEIRITNGVGRYTSNFTPPTTPFPNS